MSPRLANTSQHLNGDVIVVVVVVVVLVAIVEVDVGVARSRRRGRPVVVVVVPAGRRIARSLCVALLPEGEPYPCRFHRKRC